MKLSDSTAVIRPRSGWEAIDLGFRLVQRDLLPLSRRWLISTLPWFALCIGVGHWLGDVSLAVLLFWFLKPAFDRVLLDYLSQRLFSDRVSTPNLISLWFKLPFSFGAWRHLTYLRLSAVRTFALPVYQLEGSASNSGKRIRTLVSRDYGASMVLTILFYLLSSVLVVVAAYQLAQWFSPAPVVGSDSASFWDAMIEAEQTATGIELWLQFAFFYLFSGIFEMFFVGAGFALYLNRRTHLEAWDIELSFRRLAERLHRVIPMIALVALTVLISPSPATAQSAVDSPTLPTAEAAREAADKIYAGDEFGEPITGKKWRPKARESDEIDDENEIDESWAEIGGFVLLLASVLKYVIAAIVVLGLVIWLYRERHRLFGKQRVRKVAAPQGEVETIAEPEVFVPDADVPSVVRRLWDEGLHRESLSYLYRSALSYLTSRHQFIIGDHATEEDCLQLVCANASSTVSQYFSDITRQWRLLAYGKRLPADTQVNELCDRWSDLSDIRPTQGAARAQ
ncbi:MAG: hypothetical protein AAF465_07395 [Pseudomonadota bacterium]